MSKNSILGQMTPNYLERPTISDQVFDELYQRVISLEMPPGTKISESEVAKALGVSRQPVRDAFYRLSKLGFLLIRPQRVTTVSMISEQDVFQARFIRTALEIETVRLACEKLRDEDMDTLEQILDQQLAAVEKSDKLGFHALDDLFHKKICELAGVGFVWNLIQEHKAHMDRVRYLSLSFASHRAYEDHIKLFKMIRARDSENAVKQMRNHLSTILEHFKRIRAENEAYFATEE